MIGWILRTAVLVLLPAACACGHYLIATWSGKRATHFIVPSSQSAVVNPSVAKRAGVSFETFQRLVVGREVIIIDARHPDEYAEGHVPGAKNFHVEAVEDDVTLLTSKIDQMADIVLYCATSECEDSGRLFDIMTQLLDYPNVRLFGGGLVTWKRARLPLEKGPSP